VLRKGAAKGGSWEAVSISPRIWVSGVALRETPVAPRTRELQLGARCLQSADLVGITPPGENVEVMPPARAPACAFAPAPAPDGRAPGAGARRPRAALLGVERAHHLEGGVRGKVPALVDHSRQLEHGDGGAAVGWHHNHAGLAARCRCRCGCGGEDAHTLMSTIRGRTTPYFVLRRFPKNYFENLKITLE